jgi:hypothetical protein
MPGRSTMDGAHDHESSTIDRWIQAEDQLLERAACAQSGRRPPALIVFIVNCDVMRARPGRSAKVLMRKRS